MSTTIKPTQKIIFKKTKVKATEASSTSAISKSESDPVGSTNIAALINSSNDSTFILQDLNLSQLDRNFVLPEITRKQEREINHITHEPRSRTGPGHSGEDEEVKTISTSLKKLGIFTDQKEAMETIYWGDHYKIQLFVNTGTQRYELRPDQKIRCSHCHQYPPAGALMLAVPYKYVSSYTHEHVYAPECVNVVKGINVEPSKAIVSDKTKKSDPKSAPKINYFRRDLSAQDLSRYTAGDNRVVINGYFEAVKPVCSFNCLESKGRELAIKDPRFKNVGMYTAHLYQLIFGTLPDKIVPAPPCDILEEYGGTYTLEEYRKNFSFVVHNESNQYYTRVRNLLHSSSALFSVAKAQ